VAALRDTVKKDKLSPREAAAITLVDRIIVDPHSVDDNVAKPRAVTIMTSISTQQNLDCQSGKR